MSKVSCSPHPPEPRHPIFPQASGSCATKQLGSVLAQETPISKRMSGSTPFAVSLLPQDDINSLLAEEMKDRFVGPMPVQKFMDDYLPRLPGQEACPHIHEQHFRKIPEGASEKSFYTLLRRECGGFKLRPDVALYPENCGRTKITDFELMAMFLEVKSSDKHDPFAILRRIRSPNLLATKRDIFLNNWKFECDTTHGILTRGQMIAYALTQIGCQFRQFAFSVAIIGKHARIIRWGPWRGCGDGEIRLYGTTLAACRSVSGGFSRASAERMGLDQSVTEVEADFDGREICTKLKLPPSTQLFYYGVPDDDASRAQRDDPDLTALYRYIGPRPHFPSRSLIGRATRSPPCIRSSKGPCCIPERHVEDRLQRYAEGRRHLPPTCNGYQVPHIAPFERGNDLEGYGSHTVTHDYVEESWVCGMPFATGHIHYRMVLGVVGRELSTFRSTHELVSAVADALEGWFSDSHLPPRIFISPAAHEVAYHKAGILHRDVSVGNLIVTDDGGGSTYRLGFMSEARYNPKRRHDRTGTWQFMSGALLSDPTKHQDFEDDLESFLHERSSHLSLMFDEVHEKNGVYIGGGCKSGSPLLDLLREINPPFAVRYQVPPSKEDFHAYETARISLENSTTPFWPGILANMAYGKYQQELQNLKGVLVSWDINTIYCDASKNVKITFSKHIGSIHLVIDGWLAPFAYSYLGIVVVWYDRGKIWRSTLELIRLTQSHTGEYLAKVTVDCLNRFGLEEKFHMITIGKASRSRCFAHTVNLIAKAVHAPPTTIVIVTLEDGLENAELTPLDQELLGEECGGPAKSEDSAEMATSPMVPDEVDEAKEAHDREVVRSVRQQAIKAAQEANITMTVLQVCFVFEGQVKYNLQGHPFGRL
ncbi:hypothetical protein BD769DRAFT_1681925 [Suillus cothurnatus]|nr:hypothetical protein BD769DRAFT_1681925 [Suillus cothurnatus]